VTRVLYLSQWFFPENSRRGLQVMEGLAARGHRVEALTGFPNYPGGRLYDGYRLRPYQRERIDGATVHRVFLVPSHSRSSLGRVANYLSFALSALTFLLLGGRRYDAVYVYHPPITVGLAAAVSGLVTRRPYVLEVQDLWPDSVSASGMTGTSLASRLLRPVCRFVYRRAAVVLCQSESMTERMVADGIPAERTGTLFNWADEQFARPGVPPPGLDFDGHFNIVFGGSFGRVQGLDVLVRAAHAAAAEVPRLQLTLVGDGVEHDALAKLVAELGATNVRLLPEVPQSRIGAIFGAADVLVVHLLDDPLFEVTIPSKLQFYLAMGKPVLVAVRGEAARIVTAGEAGIAAEPGSVGSIVRAMVELATADPAELARMGDNAARTYRTKFSRAAAMRRIGDVVDGVLEGASRRAG
jgi:colanic acid biosynthesis glycosyl transferase WcaI